MNSQGPEENKRRRMEKEKEEAAYQEHLKGCSECQQSGSSWDACWKYMETLIT